MTAATRSISLRFLNRAQVESLLPGADELVSVIEAGLRAHGRKETVLPPKAHLVLDHLVNGHFNILSGYVGSVRRAGVKVIGDYVDNWKRHLPSEVALLTLYDPETGVPSCIMDATSLTWQRTGAVTCVGARHTSPKQTRASSHTSEHAGRLSKISNCLQTSSTSRKSASPAAAPKAASVLPRACARRSACPASRSRTSKAHVGTPISLSKPHAWSGRPP
jgi:hypothetical protein